MSRYLVIPKQRLTVKQSDSIIKDLFLLCCANGLGHEAAVVMKNNGVEVKEKISND